MNIKISNYPGYNEYKLISGIFYNRETVYKRGCSLSMYNHPEFVAWRKFICTDYQPPKGRDILVLHNCSWSKPYDFSYTLRPLVNICKKHSRVHRAILSNSGVIPYELQMNEVFCGYDFNPFFDSESKKESVGNKTYLEYLCTFLHDYLENHAGSYSAIIIYYPPIRTPYLQALINVCKKYVDNTFVAPSKVSFQNFVQKEYENREEVFAEPELLNSLDEILDIVEKNS